MKKYIAEFIGTFTLVFFGCATVIFMVGEVGLLGVSFAFGLSVTAMAYGIGPISGAHLNPAVTCGVWLAGKMKASDVAGYVVGQVLGGIAAAAMLYIIVMGKAGGYDIAAEGFATNGWGGYSMASALIFEMVATFLFVTVILGATQDGVAPQTAGIVIGLTLVMIHLAGITVSGSSVNPARSIGPALFAGGEAMGQLWLYIVAPVLGGAVAGIAHKAGLTAKD